MKTFKVLTIIAAAAIMMAGCRGAEGPQGPQGPQGIPGLDGTNANVVEQTYAVTSWTPNTGPNYWWAQLSDSYLTSAILNYGAVDVFVSYNSGATWNNVPYSEVVATNVTGIWTVNDAVGTVQVNYTYSDGTLGSDPNAEYSATCQFKVVCIAASVIKRHPNVNLNNYAQVENLVSQENGLKLSK